MSTPYGSASNWSIVFSFQAWVNNSICIDQSAKNQATMGFGMCAVCARSRRLRVCVAAYKTHLLFLSAPCGVEGASPEPYKRLWWIKCFQQHLRGVDAIVSACTPKTQHHRIPRTPHALFMCYEKTWLKRKKKKKKNGKTAHALLLLSAIMWSVKRRKRMRARCRQGERRAGESDFLHPQIPSWWWQGTGLLENTPYPPPPLPSHTSIPSAPLWCLSLLLSFPSLPPPDWRSVWSVPREAQTQRRYLQDPHWAHF